MANVINLDGGVRLKTQSYTHKHISQDGSICADFVKKELLVSACFYGKSLDEAAERNGFFRYRNLSEEGKRQMQLLPLNAMVYAEGSYSWLYQTTSIKIGDFKGYESTNVLCRDGSTNTGEPATCYAAALEPSGSAASSLSVFVMAIVDKPPGSPKALSLVAQHRIDAIHAVIESIQILPCD
jgi:hypothetical protein